MKLEDFTSIIDFGAKCKNLVVWSISGFTKFHYKHTKIYSPHFTFHTDNCCKWQLYVSTYLDLTSYKQCVTVGLITKVSHSMRIEFKISILNKNGKFSAQQLSSLELDKSSEMLASKTIEASRFFDENDDDQLMNNGAVTISCNIRMATAVANRDDLLFNDIGKLLDDKQSTDVTITVGQEVFHAHRLILIARSEYFKDLLFTQNLDAITIEGVKATDFQAILNYIYEDIVDHKYINLLVAADKFKLNRLKELCEIELCETLTIETVARTLRMSDRCSAKMLKKVATKFILVFLKYVIHTDFWIDLMHAQPHLVIEITLPLAKSCKCSRKLIKNSK